ncbi:MAG: hypothetical protein SVU94_11420 [Bacteroidota bacterium]|nr:hypothetical protein [Bacteroidota bacterium]
MRKVVILLSFIFMASVLKAQVWPLMPKYYQPMDSTVLARNQQNNNQEHNSLMKMHDEKISYAVTLGTGFSSLSNNMSMASSYIVPSINYQPNNKFFISVNGVIMQNNFNGFQNNIVPADGYAINPNLSNYGINSQAYYQLSDKFSIFGDATYFENQTPLFSNSQTSIYSNDYKSVSIGMGYKINDNLHINFQYRYSDGLNPMYNSFSPFYSPVYNPYRSRYNIWGY